MLQGTYFVSLESMPGPGKGRKAFVLILPTVFG